MQNLGANYSLLCCWLPMYYLHNVLLENPRYNAYYVISILGTLIMDSSLKFCRKNRETTHWTNKCSHLIIFWVSDLLLAWQIYKFFFYLGVLLSRSFEDYHIEDYEESKSKYLKSGDDLAHGKDRERTFVGLIYPNLIAEHCKSTIYVLYHSGSIVRQR